MSKRRMGTTKSDLIQCAAEWNDLFDNLHKHTNGNEEFAIIYGKY